MDSLTHLEKLTRKKTELIDLITTNENSGNLKKNHRLMIKLKAIQEKITALS